MQSSKNHTEVDAVTSDMSSVHLFPYAANLATQDFLQHVLHNEQDFAVNHVKLVRSLGSSLETRKAAISAVIEFACDASLNPMGDSSVNDQRSEICAKTLQQFLVRYHGLAESSPYGNYLFERLISRLDFAIKQGTLQIYRHSIQVLRFCIIVCVTIPGHDPELLTKCVLALKHFLQMAESAIQSKEALDLLCQCFMLLSQHAFLLSQGADSGLFDHVRESLTYHRYPPGQLTQMALETLENQAVRKYMDELQNSEVPTYSDILVNGMDEMDDEMQEDYERFLAEHAS